MSISSAQLRMYSALVIAVIIGSLASHGLSIPANPGFNASLMAQPSPVLAFSATLIAAILAGAIGFVINRPTDPNVAIKCAAVALLPMTWRGGTIFATITQAPDGSVWYGLAIELAVLGGCLILLTTALGKLIPEPRIDVKNPDPDDDPRKPEPLDQCLLAVAAHAAVMLPIMAVVAQGPDKRQALAAVFVGSLLGAMAAHKFVPARPAVWFVIAPTLLGILGYVTAALAGSPGQAIGEPQHYFAFLARPLPLDYASMGVAGGLWGYAIRRKQQLAKRHTDIAGEVIHTTIDVAKSVGRSD
jgi:hypothetical protein